MERTAILSRLNFRIGLARLCERMFPRESNYTTQLWIEARNAIEIYLG